MATHGSRVSGGMTRPGSRRESTSQISKVKEIESSSASTSNTSRTTEALTATIGSPARNVWKAADTREISEAMVTATNSCAPRKLQRGWRARISRTRPMEARPRSLIPGPSCSIRKNNAAAPASAIRHSGTVTHSWALMVRGSRAISMVVPSSRAKKITISRITCSASVEVGERAARQGKPEPDPVLFEVVVGIAEVRGWPGVERGHQALLDESRGGRVGNEEVADVAAVDGGILIAAGHAAVMGVHGLDPLCAAPPGAQEVVAG